MPVILQHSPHTATARDYVKTKSTIPHQGKVCTIAQIGTVLYAMKASHTATFTAHSNNLMLGTFGIKHSRLRKLYDIAEIGIFPPTIDHGLFICNIGIRIYRLKAADFHLPIAWIRGSLIPISAAVVAAPIRKLCALYFVGSSPANCKALPKYWQK